MTSKRRSPAASSSPAKDSGGVADKRNEAGPGAVEGTPSTAPGDAATAPPAGQNTSETSDSQKSVSPTDTAQVSAPQGSGRKRGRPLGSRNQPREYVMNPNAPGSDLPRALADHDRDAQYMATARTLVDVCTGSLETLLAPDWEQCKPEEQKFLHDAAFKYVKAKRIPDLPPGIVLLGAIALYMLPRIQSPGIQARIGKIKGKLGG